MYGTDQIGPGEIQFIVALIDKNTLFIDQGTHGTVQQHQVLFQKLLK